MCVCVISDLISGGILCLHGSRWWLHSHAHKVYEGEISRHTISVAITKTSLSAAWRKAAGCVCVCAGIALGPYSHWCWLGLFLDGWWVSGCLHLPARRLLSAWPLQSVGLHNICRTFQFVTIRLSVYVCVPVCRSEPSGCLLDRLCVSLNSGVSGNDTVIFYWRGVSGRGVPGVIWKSLQRCLFNHYEWPSAEPVLSVRLWLCGCVSRCRHVCRLHESTFKPVFLVI